MLRVGHLSATHGTSANIARSAPNTTALSSPICSPEIAKRCARLLARRSRNASWLIALRSPVVIAVANPPMSPGSTDWICADAAIRKRNTANPRCPSVAGRAVSKGVRL